MDHRTHERGIGMLNTPYVKKDTIKNFFPVPNAVFDLGLHHMEISIYAYLLRIEDRRTYQCIVSYPTIAKKLGISVNTVAKYVAALEDGGTWSYPHRAHGDHHQRWTQAQRLSQVYHPANKECPRPLLRAPDGEGGASLGTAAGADKCRKVGRSVCPSRR